MTDLPEDLNRWPSDPFAVLNLDRSVDARTARRAYFKLVRKYQPDRFPAEFQKVREAYEYVENWLKWQQPDVANEEDDLPNSNEADSPGMRGGNSVQETGRTESAEPFDSIEPFDSEKDLGGISVPSPFRSDPFDQFVESLESGEMAAAVALVNRVDPSSGPAETAKVYLSKYYLSRFLSDDSINDEADSGALAEQKRVSWLLKSMASSELWTGAMAQLRTEFDRNYRLATCTSMNDCLDRLSDCANLAELYRLRWEAIGHHDVQVVIDDIEKLQPRSLEFGNRSVWLNLIAESMNYTVWHQDNKSCVKHNRECWQEISESEQTWTADSVELLILAAEEWKQIQGWFKWSSVIPWARCTLPESMKRIWSPVAKEIAVDPRESLTSLNLRFQNSSIAMAVFEEGLQRFARLNSNSESSHEETWEETRDLVACYFQSASQTDYVSNRIPMMEFCILNQLSPTSFARAADTFLSSDCTIGWSDLVQSDGPLWCVVNACQAMNW
jgi:curved DNA-binding protein CbpA